MRLYEIANTLSAPGEFRISYLKEIFCLDGSYSDNGQFLRTIRRSVAELGKSDVTLDVEIVKGSASSKKITALRLTPRLTGEEDARADAVRQTLRRHGLGWLLSAGDRQTLHEAGFSKEDICRNIVLLKAVQRLLNARSASAGAFSGKVQELSVKAQGKENPQGWIIGALRQMLSQGATSASRPRYRSSLPLPFGPDQG
jgi:hypothetical protein